MSQQRDRRCFRSCQGKIRHPSAVEAGKHAEHLFQSTGRFAEVYECGCCNGGWHVGGAGLLKGEKRPSQVAAA